MAPPSGSPDKAWHLVKEAFPNPVLSLPELLSPFLEFILQSPRSVRAVTVLVSTIHVQVLQHQSVDAWWTALCSSSSMNLWFLAKGLTNNMCSIYTPYAHLNTEGPRMQGSWDCRENRGSGHSHRSPHPPKPRVEYPETSDSPEPLQECRRGTLALGRLFCFYTPAACDHTCQKVYTCPQKEFSAPIHQWYCSLQTHPVQLNCHGKISAEQDERCSKRFCLSAETWCSSQAWLFRSEIFVAWHPLHCESTYSV